jgi:hypothetical protein
MIPTQVIKTTSSASKFGVMSILSFGWKHLFWISFILFLLPTIITSIQVSRETNNPAHPFIETGLTVINADNELDKEVTILKEDSTKLTGEKPTVGLWSKLKYNWNLILLYWKIIGLVFLILVPFKLAYIYLKWKGDRAGYETSTWENLRKSFIIGFIFIFIVNLIIVIVGLSDGTLLLKLPDSTIYQKAWFVIVQTFPFHGAYNLITYLMSLSV